ncbi:putative F-box/FBD/LRR-repeat protein At4g03220 [Rutidosis leptorrhynchoides]|uniref:putative F-box/FBD/LRR-repeat protein At4g03220 n=1 Tax=Rutidosis leptorrhynchoides TaxID=125765 RepID=UPI003A99CB15
MDFDHNNVSATIDEDRLSCLPHELIHPILSRFDTKFVVETCLLLSPRWKLIWTSMPCLNFSSSGFKTLRKFAKFVKHVLSLRDHQVQVSSINLSFNGPATQVFVRKIASYAFSHNDQELIVVCGYKTYNDFTLCLFSSQTLKHLTFRTYNFASCLTPKTPWDFPSLTTMYLDEISLCEYERESIDLFSKCVNLQNLTLEKITAEAKVFDIITPRLSNLILRYVGDRGSNVINVIAPQLENLTVINCSMKYLNIPSGFSSFCYEGYNPPRWYKDSFHSVNKVSVSLNIYRPKKPYKQEDARCIIKMLQELHKSRFLTLNLNIIECISSFPELLSARPLPFRNLISLNIDSGSRDTCKVKMSTEARNFFLENSPNATFIMKELPTEAMKEKEVREKIKADIEVVMKELQASLEQGNILTERNEAIDKKKVVIQNLMDDIQVQKKKKVMQVETDDRGGQIEEIVARLETQLTVSLGEIVDMFGEAVNDLELLHTKKEQVVCFMDRLPKRYRVQMESSYTLLLQQAVAQDGALIARQASNNDFVKRIIGAYKNYKVITSENVPSSEHLMPSETSLIMPT